MAYFSLHAYDADVWIPGFAGLNQADIGLNPDIRFAATAENVETPHGVLQPQAATQEIICENVTHGGTHSDYFGSRIETMASFYRRWYTGSGDKTWYICCSGGHFYQKQKGNDVPWEEIELPSGVSAFQSSVWSWVTYEINPQNSTDTIDVLLLSNNVDGMIMIVPPDRPSTWGDYQTRTWEYMADMTWADVVSPKWHIQAIATRGMKFGVIERFKERIWATDIPNDPDMLVYSATYDPTDWRLYSDDPDPQDPYQTEGQPEDGSGDILQPTWDGDKFFALHKFGDQLLAFKKNRIWRVVGVSPGDFVLQEQYGGGTMFFNTVCVDKERVYFEDENGMLVYDGMSASPYLRDNVEQIWRTVNKAALDQICAAIYHNRYYVAFPVGDSEVNNAMLVYNFDEGTILYYKDFYAEALLPLDNDLFVTSSKLPGKIFLMGYDSWATGQSTGAPTKWVSPWMDFGYKRIAKGGFDIYFTPEVKDTAVTLRFSVQTEKKKKTKTYTVQPLTQEQRESEKEIKGKRLHFSGNGRRFRVIIETDEGVTAPWRLIGGLQLVVETDPD